MNSKDKPTVIRIECSDRKGLVAGITRVLADADLNVVSNNEFVELDKGRFFMRTEVEGAIDHAQIQADLKAILPEDAKLHLPPPHPKKLIILATKEPHCIGDLIIRSIHKTWPASIEAVIANHPDLGELAGRFDLPFHHVPHDGLSRETHEKQVMEIIDAYTSDYIVLAKYMRILSDDFVRHYPYKMINIHHSFLPAFIGARPYQQAYDRGVKIIGATSHFVTSDLDEGPIIAQSVINVEHHHSASDLARAGKDVEQVVLARGLRLLLEDRVFVSGNRTVIFD